MGKLEEAKEVIRSAAAAGEFAAVTCADDLGVHVAWLVGEVDAHAAALAAKDEEIERLNKSIKRALVWLDNIEQHPWTDNLGDINEAIRLLRAKGGAEEED